MLAVDVNRARLCAQDEAVRICCAHIKMQLEPVSTVTVNSIDQDV